MTDNLEKTRVLSGMRPTGALHLGHLCGVLLNWKKLQQRHECFFFVADWHALTTDYAAPPGAAQTRETALAWLCAGVDPKRATIFAQSHVPAHAELCVLLSMICPLPWLLRLPTYKEQKDSPGRDLDTHGFLGYPLLQAADIFAYRAGAVPVGEDQLPHLEFARELARRFNHLYGRTESFRAAAKSALDSLDAGARKSLEACARRYRREGDADSLEAAMQLINESAAEKNKKKILRAHLLYDAEEIIPAPRAVLTEAPKLPGTDGRKMSKSYGNAVALFDSPEEVCGKLARMQTDPARKRREDPGDPEKCPAWDLHKIFSDKKKQAWAAEGCRAASIGCLECKSALAEGVNKTLAPIREAREKYDKPGTVEAILRKGARRARAETERTLAAVRRAMLLQTR